MTISAPRWNGRCARGEQTGPRLARALGGFWLARGLLARGTGLAGTRARTAPCRPAACGRTCCGCSARCCVEAGDLDRADTVLSEGSEVAAAAGAPRCRPGSASCAPTSGTCRAKETPRRWSECEAAAAVLESAGDMAGLAEALTAAGKLRFWLGDMAGSEEVLERAIACARQSGNHRAQMRASHWLAVTFHVLPIPADAAVARTEQLLQEASGDLGPKRTCSSRSACCMPTSAAPLTPARPSTAASRYSPASARRLALAESAIPAGLVGLIIGDPAAAERYVREGYEAFRAMGERGGYVVDLAVLLAEALYAPGPLR